jgi:hypothetical protein
MKKRLNEPTIDNIILWETQYKWITITRKNIPFQKSNYYIEWNTIYKYTEKELSALSNK